MHYPIDTFRDTFLQFEEHRQPNRTMSQPTSESPQQPPLPPVFRVGLHLFTQAEMLRNIFNESDRNWILAAQPCESRRMESGDEMVHCQEAPVFVTPKVEMIPPLPPGTGLVRKPAKAYRMSDEEKRVLQSIARGHWPVLDWQDGKWSWPDDPFDDSMAVWKQMGARYGFDWETVARADTGDEQDFLAIPVIDKPFPTATKLPPPVPPDAETRALGALNAAIDDYAQREFRTKGISANTKMPTLRVSREAWDAIIKPAEYTGITEYRGCPVVVVTDQDRPGIWAEAVPTTETATPYHHPTLPGNAIGAREGCDCVGCRIMREMEKPTATGPSGGGCRECGDDELHQIARAAARCYPDVFLEQKPEPEPAIAQAVIPGQKPEPAGALKAIMAAAECITHMCFHVTSEDGPYFCGTAKNMHDHEDHPFASLSTLLESVAELASAPLRDNCSGDGACGGTCRACVRVQTLLKEREEEKEARRSAVAELTAAKEQLAKGARLWDEFKRDHECYKSLAQHDIAGLRSERDALEGQWQALTPAESYRLLETGEIIQEGDEWLPSYTYPDESAKWESVPRTSFGNQTHPEGKYRRPITGGAGSQKEPARITGIIDENARNAEDAPYGRCAKCQRPIDLPHGECEFCPPIILTRIAVLEQSGLLLSELPPAEARLVIAALATVFSA